MADYYDIYYRAHVQSYGWLGWTSNGEKAGSAGYGKRLEALEIRLVKKVMKHTKLAQKAINIHWFLIAHILSLSAGRRQNTTTKWLA